MSGSRIGLWSMIGADGKRHCDASVLTAYYDLSISPPTYDFLVALCMMERERLRVGAERLEVVMLPGPNGGFRKAPLWPYSIEAREAALLNIVIPMVGLLPSCVGIRRLENREAEGYGVFTALHGFPNQMTLLSEGLRPLRSPVPEKGDYVTITLREANHWPSRNSNVKEWIDAAKALRKVGYRVIVIRDTLKADEPLEGVETSPMASKDILCRAAFYAGAAMNLGVNNGPMWLAIAMNAPVLMCKLTANDAVCCDDQFYASCGFKHGEQLPSSPAHQRVLWAEDKSPLILAALRDMNLKEAA